MTTTEQQAFNAMREALEGFIEYNDNGGPPSFDVDAMWANARAALAGAEGVPEEVALQALKEPPPKPVGMYYNGGTSFYVTLPNKTPLYAAPVVALKELWWIRTFFAKDLKTGGVVLQNIHGKEVSKWIDRVDALGGAA